MFQRLALYSIEFLMVSLRINHALGLGGVALACN